MRRAAVAAALVAAALAPRAAHACAGCRNPNMPVTRVAAAAMGPGELRASVSGALTTVNVVHEAGCREGAACDENPGQPLHLHDQDLVPGELRVGAELGLTRLLGAEVQVPFRLTHTRIRYTTLDGAPFDPVDRGVHHRNETLAGIGDPWLLLRAGGLMGGFLLQGRAGVSVPLGRTERNPFLLGARGERHQHIQFGTGTFDPVVAVDVARGFGRLSASGYAQGQVSVYENRHGFRAGTRLLVGAQGSVRVRDRLSLALGTDLLVDGPERWDGRIQQDGTLGRTELLLGAGITQSFRATTVTGAVRVPVYRHLIVGDEPAGRLSSPVMISVAVSRTFGS